MPADDCLDIPNPLIHPNYSRYQDAQEPFPIKFL